MIVRRVENGRGEATVTIFGVRAEVITAICAVSAAAVTISGALWWLSNLDNRVQAQAREFVEAQRRQATNIERIAQLFVEKESISAEVRRIAGVQLNVLSQLKELNDGGSSALRRLQDDVLRGHADIAGLNTRCQDVQGRIYDLARKVDVIEFRLGQKKEQR